MDHKSTTTWTTSGPQKHHNVDTNKSDKSEETVKSEKENIEVPEFLEDKIKQFEEMRKSIGKKFFFTQQWLSKLKNLAHGDEELMLEIIDQSIANNWQ